ncbi:hypothetical protein L798_05625 [Zootermopsis nevadensis]|uniref:Uncharacterized protein n=1 Tax=Zootermopsis nevadensis TaxID=136037 RepID=A0A067RBC3_ZOONE|nr:hypothetical protein L798_05625 [Zootermopsis nevadensis]
MIVFKADINNPSHFIMELQITTYLSVSYSFSRSYKGIVFLSFCVAIMCYYGLEIIAEKTKHMIMSWHKNSGQNHNIMIADELFENVTKSKYSETPLTSQNDIHDKSRAD